MVIRVYSTQTNATKYAEYLPAVSAGGLPVLKRFVIIKGGAGLAQRRTFHTPLGVATDVTQEELDFLEALPSFQSHVKAGFVKVVKSNVAPDKVAADMTQRDGSAPFVPNDYQAGAEPKTDAAAVSEITTAPRYKKANNTGFK